MKLNQKFYNRSTLTVARELLGKYLIHKIGKKKLIGKIVETEAYIGPRDLASHASRGRTKRTEPMFGPPGQAYIYLIYGMYYCFNVVTEKKNYPAAVLIRALEPTPLKKEVKLTNGPGKLCRYFQIDKRLNGVDLTGNILWIEACPESSLPRAKSRGRNRGIKISKNQIVSAKRIGIDYAGPWKNKKWRFYIKNNPFVSKK